MPFKKIRARLLAVVLVGGCPLLALAQDDDLETLAAELVRIRGEVEELNMSLNQKQDAHRNEMASLSAQKGDLEASKRREELRIRQMEETIETNRTRAEEAGVADTELSPVLLISLDLLDRHVDSSIPFKREERRAELNDLRTQLETGAQSPSRAANRMWSFVEDEFRLSRENGLYSQTVVLDGETVLADVAKLGSMFLYFRTKNGRYGQAKRSTSGWSFAAVEDKKSIEQIDKLFDSLRKQIRTGYFTVPNAWVQLERGQ